MLEVPVEDNGLVAADSLDTAEEDEHSLAEGTAAVRSKSSELSTRTAGTPAASQALSLANDSDSTGNKHNNSKPRWK